MSGQWWGVLSEISYVYVEQKDLALVEKRGKMREMEGGKEGEWKTKKESERGRDGGKGGEEKEGIEE